MTTAEMSQTRYAQMEESKKLDVGQMDGYVRMFDDLCRAKDDNPTTGLILSTEKNEAVARYPPVDRDEVYKEIFEQAENFKKYQSEKKD